MRCPKCQADDTKVIESRDVAGGESIRRRRECLKCQTRYTTYERIERPNLIVIKKDGTRQMFSRQKILDGLDRACEKTSVSGPAREELVARVEKKLYDVGEPEVSSKEIGNLVMEELANLDDVAYVRFASVYRHFKSLEGFERELSKIKSRAKSGAKA